MKFWRLSMDIHQCIIWKGILWIWGKFDSNFFYLNISQLIFKHQTFRKTYIKYPQIHNTSSIRILFIQWRCVCSAKHLQNTASGKEQRKPVNIQILIELVFHLHDHLAKLLMSITWNFWKEQSKHLPAAILCNNVCPSWRHIHLTSNEQATL